jgi:hypothetical protein
VIAWIGAAAAGLVACKLVPRLVVAYRRRAGIFYRPRTFFEVRPCYVCGYVGFMDELVPHVSLCAVCSGPIEREIAAVLGLDAATERARMIADAVEKQHGRMVFYAGKRPPLTIDDGDAPTG